MFPTFIHRRTLISQEHMTMITSFLKNTLRVLPALAACGWGLQTQAADKLIQVLIIDGQNNHKWQTTTPVLQEALESSGVFKVTVSTSPPAKQPAESWSTWNPDFKSYDAVVSNYNGELWPEAVRKNFETYVSNGGGFVVVHAANNSFPQWEEYNRMIGVGGWGGRNHKSGPWVHVVDGKAVWDRETEGNGGSHGQRREFPVVIIDRDHPTTKGLPTPWMHCADELYCKLRGPAENMAVQGYAYAKETDRNEPMLMTLAYGKGRVYHTPMGHDVTSMRCRGFYTTLQRGTEWAATGAVSRTAVLPPDFPTAEKSTPVPAP